MAGSDDIDVSSQTYPKTSSVMSSAGSVKSRDMETT